MPEATSSSRTSDLGPIRALRLRVWQDKRMAAFKCDPTIDYANDLMVMIENMGDIKMPSLQSIEMDRRDTRHVLYWRKG